MKTSQMKKWNSVPHSVLELLISELLLNTELMAEGNLPIVIRQTTGTLPSAITTMPNVIRIYLL